VRLEIIKNQGPRIYNILKEDIFSIIFIIYFFIILKKLENIYEKKSPKILFAKLDD
jgi:hypothetical protein